MNIESKLSFKNNKKAVLAVKIIFIKVVSCDLGSLGKGISVIIWQLVDLQTL